MCGRALCGDLAAASLQREIADPQTWARRCSAMPGATQTASARATAASRELGPLTKRRAASTPAAAAGSEIPRVGAEPAAASRPPPNRAPREEGAERTEHQRKPRATRRA